MDATWERENNASPPLADANLPTLIACLRYSLTRQSQAIQAIALSQAEIEGQLSLFPWSALNALRAPRVEAGTANEMVRGPDQPISVSCLGSFQLQVHGQVVDDWRPGRSRALFQYLVNHRARPVSRATLISSLWPNPDAKAAEASLKVALHALRQTLAANQIVSEAISVQMLDSGYQLQSDGLWLDVEAFEHACALAKQLERRGEHPAAMGMYARAVELYRGDFLDESWDDWAIFKREALKDHYLLALERLIDEAFEAGDHHECIRRCQQVLEKDRCREDAFRMLILCHGRLGQRGRVQRWFELCVATLQAELGVEPEPETVALHRRAMAGRV